jgi:hypothetical protein
MVSWQIKKLPACCGTTSCYITLSTKALVSHVNPVHMCLLISHFFKKLRPARNFSQWSFPSGIPMLATYPVSHILLVFVTLSGVEHELWIPSHVVYSEFLLLLMLHLSSNARTVVAMGESVVGYFKVLAQHFYGGTKENHESRLVWLPSVE